MGARRRGALLGLCAAAALTLTPASALALDQSVAELSVKGERGYQIDLGVSPFGATISVARFARGAFDSGSATYFAYDGGLERDRARADFGRLGRIEARFRPSGKVRRRPTPFCRGGSELVRFGAFVGTIRFRGEAGYTGVNLNRAPGKITTTFDRDCKQRFPGGRGGETRDTKPRREIVFSARSEAKGVELTATRMPDLPGEGFITATSEEQREGVTIFRQVLLISPDPAFTYDGELNSATLAPPAPFAGSASFQRIDDYASRWEGPLTVSFPGRPAVPLTGRDYSWSLRSQRATNSASTTFSAVRP